MTVFVFQDALPSTLWTERCEGDCWWQNRDFSFSDRCVEWVPNTCIIWRCASKLHTKIGFDLQLVNIQCRRLSDFYIKPNWSPGNMQLNFSYSTNSDLSDKLWFVNKAHESICYRWCIWSSLFVLLYCICLREL